RAGADPVEIRVRLPGLPVSQDASVGKAYLAMAASPQGQIIPECPVIQVMPALGPRQAPGGDFIVVQARLAQQSSPALVNFPEPIIVRQGGWSGEKLGVGLDGELVPGQVPGLVAQRCL